jgi:hypothetical protein
MAAPLRVEVISVPHDHQVRGNRIWPNVPPEAQSLLEQIELLLAQAAARLPAKVVAPTNPQPPSGPTIVTFPSARRVEEPEDSELRPEPEPSPAA